MQSLVAYCPVGHEGTPDRCLMIFAVHLGPENLSLVSSFSASMFGVGVESRRRQSVQNQIGPSDERLRVEGSGFICRERGVSKGALARL
jgi:hypothetical protein